MRLPKVYEPGEYENDIYALWERLRRRASGQGTESTSVSSFRRQTQTETYILATAHYGRGYCSSFRRMKGDETLLLPGADHAGFETQVVYERRLEKEGKSRFDFKREELYEQIWNFVAENKDNYESQFRQLGASVDWSRYVFTLDDKIIKRANATFKKMWDDGLIYRGERLVNYCTHHRTVLQILKLNISRHVVYGTSHPLTDGSGSGPSQH